MNNFTLLLVDDKEENIYALKLIIEENFENINILTAISAADAVCKIMKHEVDLILSDIQMPEISGFELIEYLSSIEQTKDIPVILITAIYDDIAFIKKGYNCGAVDYISKPIDDELLCSKLNVFLDILSKRKKDQHLIKEKEKLVLEQVKINDMIKGLDNISPQLKSSLLNVKENENDIKSNKDEIDIMNILKKI